MKFTKEEKIAAFDKIAEQYFDKNFGILPKAEMDLLMFAVYIEHRMKCGMDCSDYAISKELGITQNRVRTLKERKELKYPRQNFDWKKGLVESLKNAAYDKTTHSVKMIIQDVNVQIEFRNFVEMNGWYDEYSLNKKLSVIPIAGFMDIFKEEIEYNSEIHGKIKKACEGYPETQTDKIKEYLSDSSKNGVKKLLMNVSGEVAKEVLGILPFGSFAKSAIDLVISCIDKSME